MKKEYFKFFKLSRFQQHLRCLEGPSKGLVHMKKRPCYSFGLSTATIDYSCQSECLCVFVCVYVCCYVCVCLSVCGHNNLKNNGSIHLKLVVYENSLDEFDIGHCPINGKVTV